MIPFAAEILGIRDVGVAERKGWNTISIGFTVSAIGKFRSAKIAGDISTTEPRALISERSCAGLEKSEA